MAPLRPTSQQIDGEGDDPLVNVADSGSVARSHWAPPLIERSTSPAPTTRQRVVGFDDTISNIVVWPTVDASGARARAPAPALNADRSPAAGAGAAAGA